MSGLIPSSRSAASEAVQLFFHRIEVDQEFPLELKVPNAQTRRAMAESEEMMRRGKARFASIRLLHRDCGCRAA